MSRTGLMRPQTVALWTKAQEALISQGDFFRILDEQSAAELLALCEQKGALEISKPALTEMPFERMLNQRFYTTDNALFFTHSHSAAVKVDIRNWELSIEGDGIEKPFKLSYDELLKLPYTTVARYIECAGNGRAFFNSIMKHKAEGPQWHLGGWGIAEWTGVRLSEILNMAGLKKKAISVMPVGLDDPPGKRPMPISKALEEDTLLAYIMNGEILPPDHGFPLRAIVPGWIGSASTKWVNKLIISTKAIQVSENTSRNILIGPDYPPEPPAKGKVINEQVMKSACCLPWPAILKAGHQDISGYAWSPFGKIEKVEVSLDGGKHFYPATLSGPNIERAGTRWEFCFTAKPGKYTITPRATDEKGNTQPDISEQKWNRMGYLFGAAVPHPIIVPVSGGECYVPGVDDSTATGAGCC